LHAKDLHAKDLHTMSGALSRPGEYMPSPGRASNRALGRRFTHRAGRGISGSRSSRRDIHLRRAQRASSISFGLIDRFVDCLLRPEQPPTVSETGQNQSDSNNVAETGFAAPASFNKL
jgi:hypothetical protein